MVTNRTLTCLSVLVFLLSIAIEGQGQNTPVQTDHPSAFDRHFAPPRADLPTDNDGRLIVGGSPVDFVIPEMEAGDYCGTAFPYIDGSDVQRTNCPLWVGCDHPMRRDTFIPGTNDPIKYIRVNFVVIRDGGPSTNISQADCDTLISRLNSEFLQWKIQFCAGPASFYEDATYYNLDYPTEAYPMKGNYNCMPDKKLNIYVVGSISNPTATGMALMPFHPYGATHIYGGIILTTVGASANLKVIHHEVGHALGLFHTFRGTGEVSSCSPCYERVRHSNGSSLTSGTPASVGGPYQDEGDREGDYCSDTHPHLKKSPCSDKAGGNACDNFSYNNTPTNNIMSYSCHNVFTSQQAGRMHCMINDYLSGWVIQGGVVCNSAPPIADFVANPQTWIAPANITFIDQSTPTGNDTACPDPDTINTWEWEFDLNNTGAGSVTPSNHNGKVPPAVNYPNPGLYTVRLIVTSPNGKDTLIRTNYVSILTALTSAQCKEFDDHWTTPIPNGGFFAHEVTSGDYVTGCPNSGDYRGFYEMYTVAQPNITIGSVRVLYDLGLNNGGGTYLKVIIYGDDANNPGEPDFTNVIGQSASWFMATRLNFPMTSAAWDTMIFCSPVNLGSNLSFHVGVEFSNATSTAISDRIAILTTDGITNTHGQGAGLNHRQSAGIASNFLTDGYDFDLGIIPIFGPPPTSTVLISQTQTIKCDTTEATYYHLTNSCVPSQAMLKFSDGTQVSWTPGIGVMQQTIAHVDSAPTQGMMITTNTCNRNDTSYFTPSYTFNPTPAVEFTMNKSGLICKDSLVLFTATPSGLSNYRWDFGDGDTLSGSSATVAHVFDSAGIFTVTLEGEDGIPCKAQIIKQDIMQIVDCNMNAPNAGFGITPDPPCAGSVVFFQDSSTGNPDTATYWIWDFGDGSFAYSQNPSHTYSASGNYAITLISGNPGGQDTLTKNVTVNANGTCILPIPFQIEGNAFGEKNIISWTSLENPMITGYMIERSLDARTYEVLGKINVTPDDAGSPMSYVDEAPAFDVPAYYRVYAWDEDGLGRYSNEIELINDGSKKDWLKIWPNPTGGQRDLNIEIFAFESGMAKLQLFDPLGKLIMDREVEHGAGMEKFTIELPESAAGIYLLRIQWGDRIEVNRLNVD